MHIAYSTAEFSAERAEQFGLISDVVPAKSLDSAVEKLCAQILKAPQPAVLAIKEYAARGAIDGYSRCDRLCAQPSRCRQLIERDATCGTSSVSGNCQNMRAKHASDTLRRRLTHKWDICVARI
jgi:enoyl-CoA hydratase/carnithine racemase